MAGMGRPFFLGSFLPAGPAVLLDEQLQCLHRHLDGVGGVLSLLLVQARGLPFLVPHRKQEPQRQPSAAATTNSAADSISLALTPRRFQLSHLAFSS